MSIKDSALRFCKKIWNSPNREEIRNVVGRLKSSTRGYGNKLYPTPILGLLLYNQQALKEFEGISAVEELASWSEEQLKILFSAHDQMHNFNQQCLAPLASKLPQAINATNPYKKHSHPIYKNELKELLFTQEDSEEIIKKFHAHPAFDQVLSTLSSAYAGQIDYDQTVQQLDSEIIEAGTGGTPQWFIDFEEAKRLQHPNVDIFRHLSALVSLFNSLANLDQLIYQSLFQDELIQINRSHIIDYLWTTNGVGPSMWLMHIPYGHMYIFEVTDFVVVNIDRAEVNGLGDTLCGIHTQILPGSAMSPGILKIRMVDDNLNAYRNLIR